MVNENKKGKKYRENNGKINIPHILSLKPLLGEGMPHLPQKLHAHTFLLEKSLKASPSGGFRFFRKKFIILRKNKKIRLFCAKVFPY